jgi:hypothetical protein
MSGHCFSFPLERDCRRNVKIADVKLEEVSKQSSAVKWAKSIKEVSGDSS